MTEDFVYKAAEDYASSIASLAIKTGAALATDNMSKEGQLDRHSITAALAINAIRRAHNEIAYDASMPAGAELQRAMEREVERKERTDGRLPAGEGPVSRVLGDFAVQRHSRQIMQAIENPELAPKLNLADENIMEAVKEGGAIEELVRGRAQGAYHKLTPDQQDDVAEAIATGGMMSPEMDREARLATRIERALPENVTAPTLAEAITIVHLNERNISRTQAVLGNGRDLA